MDRERSLVVSAPSERDVYSLRSVIRANGREPPLGARAPARVTQSRVRSEYFEKLFAPRAQSGRGLPRSRQYIAFSTDLSCILASRRSWQNNKLAHLTSSASLPFSKAETSCANAARADRT